MISGKDFYNVMTGMVPLYVAMMLGYGSVKWWKILSAEQCSGINKFVALFAVPLLSFNFISTNNPYAMNYKFIGADTLQKIIILMLLTLWLKFSSKGSFEWYITLFALSTLPNTLVMGIPLLNGMYGGDSGSLMVQIGVLQAIVWYTLLLFLFEFRGAKLLISDQFPDNGGLIKSFKVDSDVVSLDERGSLETRVEVMEDGKLCVNISRSLSNVSRIPHFNDVELYSLPSSRNPSFDFSYFISDRESGGVGPQLGSRRVHGVNGGASIRVYAEPFKAWIVPPKVGPKKDGGEVDKDVHKIVRSSSAPLPRESCSAFKDCDDNKMKDSFGTRPSEPKLGGVDPSLTKLPSINELRSETEPKGEPKPSAMPPTGVIIRLILIMVWRKLIRNPNTYAGLIGLIWSFIAFRWNVEMPKIIAASIKIVSSTGLGMAMYSLGLFMALQPRIIVCGKATAGIAAVVRFLVGPAVMAAVSVAIGIRGNLLRIAIVQAALPEGIVPFVFAKEYNVHPDILSTSVIFGMLVAVPITLVYYILLGLLH